MGPNPKKKNPNVTAQIRTRAASLAKRTLTSPASFLKMLSSPNVYTYNHFFSGNKKTRKPSTPTPLPRRHRWRMWCRCFAVATEDGILRLLRHRRCPENDAAPATMMSVRMANAGGTISFHNRRQPLPSLRRSGRKFCAPIAYNFTPNKPLINLHNFNKKINFCF